jgi:DNA-binding NarL/FixJ family response regulator
MTNLQPQPLTSANANSQGQAKEPLQLPRLRLTDRELQVAYFVAQDYSDTQISWRLNIEVTTVKKHIARSLGKLRVRGRVGLAVWYVQSYGFPPYSC